MKRNTFWLTVIAGCAVVAVSCEGTKVSEPTSSRDVEARGLIGGNGGPKPISCPTQDSYSSTAEVGVLGGILSAGGMTVSIPAGALLGTQTVTLSVPASNNVEIDVSVAGAEHFVFEQPIVVTISYARCNATSLNLTPITAWYFNTETGELIEPMISVDNKLLRTVTFTTGHLSGYILAN